MFVQRFGGTAKIMEFTPDTVLKSGDVVAGVSGKTDVLVNVLGKYGNEVSDAGVAERSSAEQMEASC